MSKKLTDFFKSTTKEHNVNVTNEEQSADENEIHRPISDSAVCSKTEGNIFQPDKNYTFPKTLIGKRERSFQASWLERFPWLHYDKRYL